jgi:hypothetical protein
MESKDKDATSRVAASENGERGAHKIADQDHLLFPTTDNSLNRHRTRDVSCDMQGLRGRVDEKGQTEDKSQKRDKANAEAENCDSRRQESGAIRKSLQQATSRNKPHEGSSEKVWETHEHRESIQEPCRRKQQQEVRTSICWPQLSGRRFQKLLTVSNRKKRFGEF